MDSPLRPITTEDARDHPTHKRQSAPEPTMSLSSVTKPLPLVEDQELLEAVPRSPESSQDDARTMMTAEEDEQDEIEAGETSHDPLRLLNLPVDILQLVLKEVSHTNDLVALALTHSYLHELVIPQIYSRFDIVWPDSATHAETRTGVDALTFGLATLVMSKESFASNHSARAISKPPGIGNKRKRRGNDYAKYTKKFSLGNGPEQWIKDYLADTESGKMLGTLVALAIARMRNLENFLWDMPTGIVPDVWNALASLDEHEDGLPCRLEKVWVRWHNNSAVVEGKHRPVSITHDPHAFWTPISKNYSPEDLKDIKRTKVERPTFSVLPPLKSLNVLDIDECAYLDEMSIAISKSRKCLRELRVGIAQHAVADEWAVPHHDVELDLSQVATGKSLNEGNISIFEKRLGGVLGILLGHTFDLTKERARTAVEQDSQTKSVATSDQTPSQPLASNDAVNVVKASDSGASKVNARFVEELSDDEFSKLHRAQRSSNANAQLNLETLALERLSLSIPILAGAFRWTCIREMTLLDCQFTASLWQHLRRQYTPSTDSPELRGNDDAARFPLKLRKLHTNTVTPQLLAFIKETLPPNTLEILFLQQSEYHLSRVTSDAIMKAIKRHRASLMKLLVDSSERDDSDNRTVISEGWDRWLFTRDMLHFITSGKMPRLIELGVAMSQRDWHYLLQRLPFIPHIRALYLPYIAKTTTTFISGDDVKELAHQVLDVVIVRPEIELCYLALASKCFEITESRVKVSESHLDSVLATTSLSAVDEEDEDDEAEDEEDDDEDEEDVSDASDSEDSDMSDAASDGDSEDATCIKMDIREILFYDDKVAIFKARHGRL